jgi:hypothetical protein
MLYFVLCDGLMPIQKIRETFCYFRRKGWRPF